jgi:hypothetical protein
MYIIAGIIHLYEDTYALFLLFYISSTEIRESGAKAHSPHLFNNIRQEYKASVYSKHFQAKNIEISLKKNPKCAVFIVFTMVSNACTVECWPHWNR